jgi:signal transduction histidine kinase
MSPTSTKVPLITIAIRREFDMLLARHRGRRICQLLGFSNGDTTRIATALSEVARNAFEYAGGGTATFTVENNRWDEQELVIRVVDEGHGIADITAVLSDEHASFGIGLRGSRALMDRLEITSHDGTGTVVTMAKQMPPGSPRFTMADGGRLVAELATQKDVSPLGELNAQNQSLLTTLREVEQLRVLATKARERAESAQLVAERSLVVNERFMALTTHEIRTPLNAVIGYLDLLAIEVVPIMSDRQKDFFGRVQRASQHLLGITNDFLVMAQGEAGRLQLSCRESAARTVMREAAALIMPQALARDVTVRLAEADDELTYFGDENRVRQVLVNLLGNAVSFSPAGSAVDVVAERVLQAEGDGMSGGPWSVFRVTDSGPGIPSEKLAQVFEPFVQLPSDVQSTRKGSGLGLTVSRQLAQLMGGDLTAANADLGARFALWLPHGAGNSAAA